jgi:glyoxylase-like metal-dependent hydrolase (beta-lactamase superfamily II)
MKIVSLEVGELETNCYLLRAGDDLAVIDPGDEANRIADAATAAGGELKYIILTHYHPDHTAAARELKSRRGGEILLHEEEKNIVEFKVDRYLREGDKLTLGDEALSVLHTPGHTPGGICLLGGNLIFTGDTLFLNGYGRTDLEWSSEEDMKKSLERLEKIITPNMRVYPGHGAMSKISNV